MFCRIRQVSARGTPVLPFPVCACCCFFCHLVYCTTPHIPTPATLNSAGSSNIRCDEHGASFLLSASLRHQSKAAQASTDRLPITEWWSDPCHLPIPGPVPGSGKGKQPICLGRRQNHRQPSQQPPASSKHTAHLRTAPATPPRPPPPPPGPARTHCSIITTQRHTSLRAPLQEWPPSCQVRTSAVLSTTYRCPLSSCPCAFPCEDAQRKRCSCFTLAAPAHHLAQPRSHLTPHSICPNVRRTALRLPSPPPPPQTLTFLNPAEARRPSPNTAARETATLSVNLSSNNPFRNRAVSPGLLSSSPRSFDTANNRMSRNPFLDASDFPPAPPPSKEVNGLTADIFVSALPALLTAT